MWTHAIKTPVFPGSDPESPDRYTQRVSAETSQTQAKRTIPESDGPEVEIRLLGEFAMDIGGQRIPASMWRRRKASQLVKLLALAPGHQRHREEVCDLLWPDASLESATRNLHYTMHLLRRIALADGTLLELPVTIRDENVVLCPDRPPWVDMEAFESAARAALADFSAASCQAAVSIYRGDLLPGDPYDEWLQAPREYLRERYVSLLDVLADRQEQAHDLTNALITLRTLVEKDPVRETGYRRLMRLLAQTGQRFEALRQYERLSESLERELGTQPDTLTVALRNEIKAGAHDPRPASTPVPLPLGRDGDPPAGTAPESLRPVLTSAPFTATPRLVLIALSFAMLAMGLIGWQVLQPRALAPAPTPQRVVLAESFQTDPSPAVITAVAPSGAFQAGVREGAYVIQRQDPEFRGLGGARVASAVSNGALSLDVRVLGSAPRSLAVLQCRRSGGPNQDQYRLELSNAQGAYRLSRFQRNARADLVDWTVTSVIQRGNALNRVTLGCVGSELTVTVNGVRLATLEDPGLSTGEFGFGAAADAGGHLEVRFGNLELRES